MKYAIAQNAAEFDAYVDLLRSEKVGSYLEIGSKFGGSLWQASRGLKPGSRIVSVDLPHGRGWKESSGSLKACISELNAEGFDAQVIFGSSQDHAIIQKVGSLAPFDAVFIDGDHRLAGVSFDWTHYAPMGRIVAFHDIGWRRPPEWQGGRIDVPEFWDALKASHRHQEFKFCPTGRNNGIGVLWRV